MQSTLQEKERMMNISTVSQKPFLQKNRTVYITCTLCTSTCVRPTGKGARLFDFSSSSTITRKMPQLWN